MSPDVNATWSQFTGAPQTYAPADNPAKEAERLKIATENEDDGDVTPDKVYTKEEIRELIKATEAGSLERLFIMLPALTGLRIGEALGGHLVGRGPQDGQVQR
jgi:integrase